MCYDKEKHVKSQDLSNTDLLYQREALKIEILADRPKILAFIKNSYQLWMGAQWGVKSPHDVFYGAGGITDVLGRQLARKSCMAHWRNAKETGDTTQLIEPVATVLNYTREIASELQDYLGADTPYDALVEFQTPGFSNPLTDSDLKELHAFVKDRQTDEPLGDHLHVPIDIQDKIIKCMIDLAGLDDDKVEILYNTAHPACMGYGGIAKGVKLGITHDPHMTPFKSLITNWHEIGHAVYRQSIPYGHFVAGRAMDEAVAFLFEYWVGYSDDFMQMMLDEGLSSCGYDMQMLKSHATDIIRNTKRIETNPIRHLIDIDLCEKLERALVNGDIEGEDCEVFWAKIIDVHADILPVDYPYYYDVHMMSGIYGDRASYNPGLLGAMQIGESKNVTLDNLNEVVHDIAQSGHDRFDEAIQSVTGQPLSKSAFWNWKNEIF
jgi:Zn-dependent M32 family carboxypeptidase